MRFRGFKDHGLEGKMRIAIHHIEENSKTNTAQNQVILLTIRRHEKDFIIRKDPVYAEKLEKTVILFKENIN